MSAEETAYALLDHVPLGVCVLDRGFRVRFWNTCLERWTLIDRDDILGTDLSRRYPNLREPRYRQRLETIFDGGPPTVFSSQLHRHLIRAPLPGGELRIQHTVVTAVPSAAGDGYDAMLSIQDVTDLTRQLEDLRALRRQALREAQERQRAEAERRRLEARIQHAQKLESLEALAGGIAHDFNNLLVGILGNADLVLGEEPEGSPRRKNLEAIIHSAQRAAELSNQMLAFSGKGKFVTRVVDLCELVAEVVELMASNLPKRTALRLDVPEQPLQIEADASQIRQVIVNLISNAADAIGEQKAGTIALSAGVVDCEADDLRGPVTVDELPAGAYVYLDVVDDGTGMSPETVEKIFEPFYTTKFAGRGLGLATVQGVVRGHNGTIQVESRLGAGSTFRLLIPACGRSAVRKPVPAAPRRRSGTVDGATVLVVDDEEAVRAVAQRILERSGFGVITAASGSEAVRIFRRRAEEIMLVLLDMTMPRLSGRQTCHELRRIRDDVRVVLSSGYTEEVATDEFSGLDLSGFLQKPYRPRDLVAKVKEALGVPV